MRLVTFDDGTAPRAGFLFGEEIVPTGSLLRQGASLLTRGGSVRGLLQTPDKWHLFPDQVQEWLKLQKNVSRLPGRSDLLVETFPRGDRWYLSVRRSF